jgi:TetR/AcrR family transcriptional regulator, fatty acid metabolism regulator protein
VVAAADKRERILAAAVRVFARQGFESTRMADVAREAGVAYGLVYHYFGSKDAVLQAVFREAWGRLLAAVALAEQTGKTAPEQLELVVRIVLRVWRDEPDLVRLLVREVTRSPHISDELDEIGRAFTSLERIVRRGQDEGSFRPEVDARLAAWMLYGALEEVLTGWVLGRLPDDAASAAAAEREVVATFVDGLRAAR